MKKVATPGERAIAYMRGSMAMRKPTGDQRQNWILGHLVTFADQEVKAERRRIRRELLAVGVIREGVWVFRASVIAAIKKATRAPR